MKENDRIWKYMKKRPLLTLAKNERSVYSISCYTIPLYVFSVKSKSPVSHYVHNQPWDSARNTLPIRTFHM